MTCKQCVHHERFHDDAFYCEAQNDLMDETDDDDAEQCRWFCRMDEHHAGFADDIDIEPLKIMHHFED